MNTKKSKIEIINEVVRLVNRQMEIARETTDLLHLSLMKKLKAQLINIRDEY